jgi:nicotinamide riboside transporter PnuC
MSSSATTLMEWGSTLLSILGFWLCIQHRASCFVVFFVADVGWLVSAWLNRHPALLAQQVIYILLNVVGYVIWQREQRLKETLDRIEQRELAEDEDDEEPIPKS